MKNRFTEVMTHLIEEFRLIADVIWKSFEWSLFTLFFGLLQIWIIIAWYFLSNPQLEETIFEQIIMGGALLFFSVAIVSSLTIDHYLAKTTFKTQDFSAFFLFPMVIIISCIVVFFSCYGKSSHDVNFELVFNVELVILSITLIYAFGIKCTTYHAARKNK